MVSLGWLVVVLVPCVYAALYRRHQPSPALALSAAPFAWGGLGLVGALCYFKPGGTLPQVGVVLAMCLGGIAAVSAFFLALAVLRANRKSADALAIANLAAWGVASLLAAFGMGG